MPNNVITEEPIEEIELVVQTDGMRTSDSKRLSTVNERAGEEGKDSDSERFEQNLQIFENKEERDTVKRIKIARADLNNLNSYLKNSCAAITTG